MLEIWTDVSAETKETLLNYLLELIVNQVVQLYDKKDYSWDYKAFPIITAEWYICNFLKNRTDELLCVSNKIHSAISKALTGVFAKNGRDNLKPHSTHIFFTQGWY